MTRQPLVTSAYAASPALIARVQRALADADPVVVSGKVTRASGIIVEATLPQVAVGTVSRVWHRLQRICGKASNGCTPKVRRLSGGGGAPSIQRSSAGSDERPSR